MDTWYAEPGVAQNIFVSTFQHLAKDYTTDNSSDTKSRKTIAKHFRFCDQPEAHHTRLTFGNFSLNLSIASLIFLLFLKNVLVSLLLSVV